MRVEISGINNARTYINRAGQQLGRDFQKTMIKEVRTLSKTMQKDLTASVNRGAVAFTNRAILFQYKINGSQVTTSIRVKDIQAKYLYDVIVKKKRIKKFVPTNAARLTRQGNIAGLRTNLASGKFKIVKQGNKERLIDTSKKKKVKRVIALREEKERKLIYDFYQNAERGAVLIFRNIRGTFRVTRQ